MKGRSLSRVSDSNGFLYFCRSAPSTLCLLSGEITGHSSWHSHFQLINLRRNSRHTGKFSQLTMRERKRTEKRPRERQSREDGGDVSLTQRKVPLIISKIYQCNSSTISKICQCNPSTIYVIAQLQSVTSSGTSATQEVSKVTLMMRRW